MADLTHRDIGRLSPTLAIALAVASGPTLALAYRWLSILALGPWLFAWALVLGLWALYIVFGQPRALVLRIAVCAALFATSSALSCGGFSATAAAERRWQVRRAGIVLPAAQDFAASACRGLEHTGGTVDGRRVFVECGPPVRIAFVLPGGWLDNWSAIVYDPSGEVLSIPEPRPTVESTPHRLRGLFGGTITSCIEAGPDFYYCSFT